ncbi:MAG: peroxiredoxin [Bacteroidaceae bacterium]|nr:peroxiredoxin [Bacteroidaceae bacterium]
MKVGDKLPEVLGVNERGEEVTLAQFRGKKLIVYAYPKDNTSGCTAEACSLKEHYAELQKAGYAVVGVSKDSAASHQKFIEKHGLPFPLIADTDKTLLQALGAWGEKTMYGKKVEGTLRTTYLVNEEGIVEKIFTPKDIKTKIHAEQILEQIAPPSLD